MVKIKDAISLPKYQATFTERFYDQIFIIFYDIIKSSNDLAVFVPIVIGGITVGILIYSYY